MTSIETGAGSESVSDDASNIRIFMNRCIIFDCDGTLVDSEYLDNYGLEIKLKDYGVEVSADEMMKNYRGSNLSVVLEEIEKKYCVKLKDDFVVSYRSFVDILFGERLRSFDGVAEALESIKLPKCVASNAPLEKVNRALSISGLNKYFDGNVFSSYEIGSWKPEPDIFLHAAEVMGVPPERCVVVEDSLIGVAAAKSANMLPILFDPEGIHSNITEVHRIQHMQQLQNVIDH